MDRKLHALVTRDVLTDTVRIDVRGSLNEESRPSLIHLIRRVRSMGISSHIFVDLSLAVLVESTALAGLRTDLNAMDGASAPESAGAGVSLVLNATPDAALSADGLGGQSLAITDELAEGFAGTLAVGFSNDPTDGAEEQIQPPGDATFGRPLSGYTDEELFAASDATFALLDNPEASGGSDLLARYNAIGLEIARRNPLGGLYDPVGEGQAAS